MVAVIAVAVSGGSAAVFCWCWIGLVGITACDGGVCVSCSNW